MAAKQTETHRETVVDWARSEFTQFYCILYIL